MFISKKVLKDFIDKITKQEENIEELNHVIKQLKTEISDMSNKIKNVEFRERVIVVGNTDIVFIKKDGVNIYLHKKYSPMYLHTVIELKEYFIEKIKNQYYIGVKYNIDETTYYMVENDKVTEINLPLNEAMECDWIVVKKEKI